LMAQEATHRLGGVLLLVQLRERRHCQRRL
jgi:hypothetical protein